VQLGGLDVPLALLVLGARNPSGFDGAQDRGLNDRRALLTTRVEGTQHVIGRTGERPTVKWLSVICAVERYHMKKFFRKSPKSFHQG
jgi:hypothetical protein